MMTKNTRLARLCCWLAMTLMSLAAAPATMASQQTTQLLNIVDQNIIRSYQQLKIDAVALNKTARALCRVDKSVTGQVLKQAYLNTSDSWQRIQHISFGPVSRHLRAPRFQLWPDKRGSVSKHLRRVVANQGSALLGAERFAFASVAIQGLSALEQLLFTDPYRAFLDSRDPSKSYQCVLVKAITGNLENMSIDILNEWQMGNSAYRTVIATAEQGNENFENTREVKIQLLNNLYTQLQLIEGHKLGRVLGESIGQARGRKAESWRSERAYQNIQLNIESCRDLYQLAFAEKIKNVQLKQTIDHHFLTILLNLSETTMPLFQSVSDEKARKQTEKIRSEVQALVRVIVEKLTVELDLTLGFNSLDGD